MWGLSGTYKKQGMVGLLLLLVGGSHLQAKYTVEHIKVGDYGTILAHSNDCIRGATVEKVVIYPQQSEGSSATLERNGELVRYPDAVATVLLCHGFMCCEKDISFLRGVFPRGLYNIMTFDFRAHGEKREGQFCTLGRDEALDVIAAGNFLRNHPELKDKPLYLYGFSMGAVASIQAQVKNEEQSKLHLASLHASKAGTSVATSIDAIEPGASVKPLFDAMVLDCPFDSTERIIRRGIDSLKFNLFGYSFYIPGRDVLQRYAFHPYVQSLLKLVLKAVANMDSRDIATRVFPLEPTKTVAKISVPTLFIYCKKDQKLSVDAMREMFNNAGSSYKKLWLTNGRGHFDSFFHGQEKYKDMVRTFLDQARKGQLAKAGQEIIEDGPDEIT